MTGMTLLAGVLQQEPPNYRKGCPSDLALVASDGERGVVLERIGPALDYWHDHYGDDEGDWDGIEPGLWVIEAHIQTHGGGYFEDYDEELMLGEPRKLTDAEWVLYREEGCPWDTGLWLEPRAEVAPDEAADA